MKGAVIAGLLVVNLACAVTVQAQEASGTPSIRQLRSDVTDTQEEFIGLYNKLNQDDSLKISCRNEPIVGTRLTTRICRTRAEERAQAKLGQDYIEAAQFDASLADPQRRTEQMSTRDALRPPPTNSTTMVSEGEALNEVQQSRVRFDENLQRLLAENEELRRLMEAHVAARGRYEAAAAQRDKK